MNLQSRDPSTHAHVGSLLTNRKIKKYILSGHYGEHRQRSAILKGDLTENQKEQIRAGHYGLEAMRLLPLRIERQPSTKSNARKAAMAEEERLEGLSAEELLREFTF